MNEHELRMMVREAVARHLGGPTDAPIPQSAISQSKSSIHASHALYGGLVTLSDACVIEPAVSCDHCGYCKSHGH
jgi:hypothetical protein